MLHNRRTFNKIIGATLLTPGTVLAVDSTKRDRGKEQSNAIALLLFGGLIKQLNEDLDILPTKSNGGLDTWSIYTYLNISELAIGWSAWINVNKDWALDHHNFSFYYQGCSVSKDRFRSHPQRVENRFDELMKLHNRRLNGWPFDFTEGDLELYEDLSKATRWNARD